jgi:hypothetical protein
MTTVDRASSMPAASKRIGIDFDNTIVSYDRVFLETGVREGLLPHEFVGDKQAIRDAIRLLPNGELAWQHLQGIVYGRGVAEAMMFEGVDSFLRRCRHEGHAVFVVSHKTEYGHFDPHRINLRTAALDWMRRHGFFDAGGYALSADAVFFESSRSDKLHRIARIGCTHFIDDLEEVLNDPEFPPINRILFASPFRPSLPLAAPPTERCRQGNHKMPPFRICSSWDKIEAEVFGERG